MKKNDTKPIYILGLSSGMHDSSAALLKDGKLVAFAEEERFNRKKHTAEFPYNAIKYCMESAGITIEEIYCISYFWNPFKGLIRRSLNSIKDLSFRDILSSYPKKFFHMLSVPLRLSTYYGYKNKFRYIEHHDAHISAAYYLSGYSEAAVISADGTGEEDSIVASYVAKADKKNLLKVAYPASLGFFYGAFTEYLGFKMHSDEGKVMGLAAYGKPVYYDDLKKMIDFNDSGLYVDMDYFYFRDSIPNIKHDRFSCIVKPRLDGEIITEEHKNLAASVQKILEELLLSIITYIRKQVDTDNLCLNGGVFLNCVANSLLLTKSGFRNIFIFPAANDAGSAIGAALSTWHDSSVSQTTEPLSDMYLGPEYSDIEIMNSLAEKGLSFRRSENICAEAAAFLAEDKILGWFQGRMEGGPRALGNRSILASPLKREMKDILNDKVKHRESFRPFAPVVALEDKEKYFHMQRSDSPYMLLSFQVKEEYIDTIPAVVHVDKSARVQTVTKASNNALYTLIQLFGKKSGVPVLLNTSFNVMGEPIVCSPSDAIDCFLNTGIDALCIGDYIIEK